MGLHLGNLARLTFDWFGRRLNFLRHYFHTLWLIGAASREFNLG
jgi:hypothetical protein